MTGLHVAVSGISGFIASQITLDLLKRGYHVHGTVRKNVPETVQHLVSHQYPGTLDVFEADLTAPNSFDAALQNCNYAIHVASPYIMNVKNPQTELVDPAVQGTLNFLTACRKAAVKKVVLTSCFAAISDRGDKGRVFSENDWNTQSNLVFLPYFYSKVQAERLAWNFVKETDIHLITINPVGVFGSSHIKPVNPSVEILIKLVTGKVPGILDLDIPCVDVCDVSEAHIRAMESPKASGRYICCPTHPLIHMKDLVHIAQEIGFDPPTRDMTAMTRFVKTFSRVTPGGTEGQFIRTHLGNAPVPSNAKIREELGMSFRDPKDVIRDTFLDLIKRGHLNLPVRYTA